MSNFIQKPSSDLISSFGCRSKIQVISSPLHADGVIAREVICVGDTVYAEKPLCFLQTLPNAQDILICGGCQTVPGGLDVHVGILSKSISRKDVSNMEDFCQCQANCGVLYCSGLYALNYQQ